MNASTTVLFSLIASIYFTTAAQASCLIYTPENKYMGDMITTGSSYVGNTPGGSDSTPYAGSIKNGEVFIRERDPQKVGTVKDTQFFDLQGRLVAELDKDLRTVIDPSGRVLAKTEMPYNDTKICEPGVALAGWVMFILYGR